MVQVLWGAQEICWDGRPPPPHTPTLQCLGSLCCWYAHKNSEQSAQVPAHHHGDRHSSSWSLSKDPVPPSGLAWHVDRKGGWIAILSRAIKPRKTSWLAVKPHKTTTLGRISKG